MVKRGRKSRRRRSSTRTVYSRSRSRSNPGTWMSVIGGLATGAANALFGSQLGVWNLAVPAALIAAFTRSEALETIAGFETGRNLANLVRPTTGGTTSPAFGFSPSFNFPVNGNRNFNLLG